MSGDSGPSVVDLFCGAGGLSEGLRQAGFVPRVGLDFDKHAANTYRHNHPGVPVIEKDIASVSGAEILKLAGTDHIDLIAGGPSCQGFRVQFHPSYGYEDFVEGYRPHEEAKSGYQVVDKIFLSACRRAEELNADGRLVVIIVDELNRGDPARIFGELLTYIERDYREEKFTLPFSGRSQSIPKNLILLGTMNPYDRSIAQSDAAFVRRFDHILIEPSREVAEQLLEAAGGFDAEQVSSIGEWFENVQRILPFGLGHSYLARLSSIDDLLTVWRYRIRPAVNVALELSDQADGENVGKSFEALIKRLEGAADGD